MRILFIYSNIDTFSSKYALQYYEMTHFGISYVSAYLKQAGNETRLLVLARDSDFSVINECIDSFKPGLVCFTAVYSEYFFMDKVARYIKDNYSDLFLFCGGSHVTLNAEDCLDSSFDGLCIGEGESPALELVQQLEQGMRPTGISNTYLKNNGVWEKNAPRPFIDDLDALPVRDMDMWEPWVSPPIERHVVLVGRGCPFKCTYCSNHALRKIAEGRYVRFRSPGKIVEEIEMITRRFPLVREIYLEVETLSSNMQYASELMKALCEFNDKRETPIAFGANVRVTPNIDLDDFFLMLQKCNFKYINIGLESGSERVRKEVLNRNYSNEDIVNVVNSARKNGLKICFYNLIGIPGETYEDFLQTVQMNRTCQSDWHYLSIFFPYPGTRLFETTKEAGLLPEDMNFEMERTRALLDLPGFSRKQIQRAYLLFDYNVYKGRMPYYKILALVIRRYTATNFYLNKMYRTLTGLRVFDNLRKVLNIRKV